MRAGAKAEELECPQKIVLTYDYGGLAVWGG